MIDTYLMVGCVDFETDAYAISIPVLQRERSNYIYIPKTDHHFIVTDFFEMPEFTYRIRYCDKKRPVSISEKTPVPILEGDHVYVLEADWTDAEIGERHPRLGREAVKAFISLRSRMAARATESAHGEIEEGVQDLLNDPVRSKYWVSRFAALVRSAFESGEPSRVLVQMMEDARLKWIEKYSTKTTLALVMHLMEVPGLELRSDAAKKVLLRRFEGLLGTKGIFLPRSELVAHEKIFPEGILPAIRVDADGEYDYWRRGSEIGRKINDQIHALLHPADSTRNRAYDHQRWSLTELDRILRLLNVLGGEDHLLEQAGGFFYPLFDSLLEDMTACLSNRYEWTSALSGRVNVQFLNLVCQMLDVPPYERAPATEQWLKIIGGVLEYFRKLVVLAKIVGPANRRKKDSDIAFQGIDHALVDALNHVYLSRKPEAISVLLRTST
ncbi:hypothetical protein [Rhizobium gallicum]|uniref:hypothetical protein n=1 Tax=Rhizobium gallicum TaxID=56730 RepID=UPI001EF93658|nr:hypothetical protein [Rhizobium gallicum]ULJ72989.1 hypothetical protein L2W42_04900 [Rhizobium gallicum]